MSQPITVVWPDWLMPSRFSMGHDPHDVSHLGLYSRTTQVQELDVDLWRVTLDIPPARSQAMTAAAEAFIGLLRGRSNLVALGDMRPGRWVPRGTLRGNPTLSGMHAQGVHVLSVQAQPGETVKAGDRLGVVAQVFEAAQDAVADVNGLLAVRVTQRTWVSYPHGATVQWNRPVTRFRRDGSQPSITTVPGYSEGWTISLVQHVDPAVITAVVPSAPTMSVTYAQLPSQPEVYGSVTVGGYALTLNGNNLTFGGV